VLGAHSVQAGNRCVWCSWAGCHRAVTMAAGERGRGSVAEDRGAEVDGGDGDYVRLTKRYDAVLSERTAIAAHAPAQVSR